ncbi:DUF3263 domain-containing protein [Rhodococcus wratislaviensis]|uniref:DUF3263 domain-containing protein n=1 Tax=Rhodococcus wratislaviensis NBRC 100605 TaxID=1219028 RepID=X0PWH9_RHOWR|nr:DUF3263 domain-containing protein [Rhodococcus wratislaviensis]GAF47653.1 hypothetical protein RW1_043_00880 [Rhodococcus wratislaviensis NBRC 100605]
MLDNTAAILAFATKWRHWGGGPTEDIFVEFGLTAPQYFERLHQLLRNRNRVAAHGVSPIVHDQLRAICEARLARHPWEQGPPPRQVARPENSGGVKMARSETTSASLPMRSSSDPQSEFDRIEHGTDGDQNLPR